MFVGEYQSALGIPKNRVSLPTKIYSLLTNRQVVLSKGFDRCIVGYEVKAWEQSVESYLHMPTKDAEARRLRRFIFANATIVPFDKQGRAVIPPFLAEYGGLSKEIVIVGLGDHFEMWDKSRWEQESKQLNKGI
ncbi:MAG TPA: division/cell wall cluster transcriptional repressor MraZ [Patescibacteria group bacterium]|nr:division/cell wall cluster transcriptional repressor MraZ [Patescibacteria group bacterium]